MITSHEHRRSTDPETPKSWEKKLKRFGAICGSGMAILALLTTIFIAGDKYALTPGVQARTLPLILTHEHNDSVKWVENEQRHKEIISFTKQEFKVIMIYTKAGMSERARREAQDAIVNDSTIEPELKNQY
jgi:hypothetical protein